MKKEVSTHKKLIKMRPPDRGGENEVMGDCVRAGFISHGIPFKMTLILES